MLLSIIELLRYLEGEEHSRCIKEGERILEANHLVENGVVKNDNLVVEVFGLCIQTSSINSNPHSITGTFEKNSNGLAIKSFDCSCVAGKGGTCKHISALLILCTRTDVLTWKQLSCTDIKCLWAEKKNKALEQYQPVPVQDFCCCKRPLWIKNKDPVSPEDLKFYLTELINVCPDSNLARHQKLVSVPRDSGLDFVEETSGLEENGILQLQGLVEELLESTPEFSFEPNFLCLSDEYFYKKKVLLSLPEATALCLATVSQSCPTWHEERAKRITGSVCYNLYTYCANKNPDWEKKFKSNHFTGNAATLYGQRAEKMAKKALLETSNFLLFELGLIVNPNTPWFGYSPDGILLQGKEVFLLEVKCPVLGKTQTATEVVKKLPYVQVTNGEVTLKTRHKYYGQIQLGLILCGIKKCVLLIFSSFDNSYVTINVPFNAKFSKSLFTKLSIVYFNHFLPTLSFNLDL